MTAAAFNQAVGTNWNYEWSNYLDSNERSRKISMTLIPKSFGINRSALRKGNWRYSYSKICGIHMPNSHSTIPDQISFSPQSNTNDSCETSNESSLILIRHGESMWNEKNLFTGCVDVPLTKKGVEEAIEAGKRISSIPIDIIYASALVRSQMTAMLALTQHCCKKVPIVMHNETEQARIWSQIYSQDTKRHSIPVIKAWQLNERMYGDLQGFNKQETAEKYGKEQVQKWRRSYEVRPPNGESLEMCLERAVAFFREDIEPKLLCGKHVMVVAHANSLRSIIMYLDKLTPQEVINLELSTGVPMLYIYKEGNFIRRGSPPGPAEASVYAYTSVSSIMFRQLKEELRSSVSVKEAESDKLWSTYFVISRSSLAIHRQIFDEMSH